MQPCVVTHRIGEPYKASTQVDKYTRTQTHIHDVSKYAYKLAGDPGTIIAYILYTHTTGIFPKVYLRGL